MRKNQQERFDVSGEVRVKPESSVSRREWSAISNAAAPVSSEMKTEIISPLESQVIIRGTARADFISMEWGDNDRSRLTEKMGEILVVGYNEDEVNEVKVIQFQFFP